MGRVKLSLPDQFIFNTDLPVRITDINYGGHLGNDAVLGLIHEARYRMLQKLGYSDEIHIGDGSGIIVADAVIVYKSESFHGDQLRIHIAADDFNAYGLDLYYILLHRENGKEIARAKTGIVFLDYTDKKIARIPVQFIKRLGELQPYSI